MWLQYDKGKRKGGKTMSREELICFLIDEFADYQEIRKANKEENPVLEYKIKSTAVKLSSLGVNVEDLIL